MVKVSKSGITSEFRGRKIPNGVEFIGTAEMQGEYGGSKKKVTYLRSGNILEQHISIMDDEGFDVNVLSSLYYHRL